jgi:hypothetical protein
MAKLLKGGSKAAPEIHGFFHYTAEAGSLRFFTRF